VVRFTAKLPSLKQRLITAAMLTTRQLGELLGVKRSTIRRWHAQGLVEARICNELGEWLYWPEADP
jgi:transposase-like protein